MVNAVLIFIQPSFKKANSVSISNSADFSSLSGTILCFNVLEYLQKAVTAETNLSLSLKMPYVLARHSPQTGSQSHTGGLQSVLAIPMELRLSDPHVVIYTIRPWKTVKHGQKTT